MTRHGRAEDLQALQVSTSAPTEPIAVVQTQAAPGLTPATIVLIGAASIALWAMWITLCFAVAGAWTADPPPHWSPG